MLDVDVTAPADSIRDHQFSHQSTVAVPQLKVINDPFVGMVPPTEHADDEGVEEDTLTLSIIVLHQGGIFPLLFLSRSLEGGISIFERHGYIYNGHSLVGFVDRHKVWSERPLKAWYHLVNSNSGGGRSIVGPC